MNNLENLFEAIDDFLTAQPSAATMEYHQKRLRNAVDLAMDDEADERLDE